MAKILVTGSRGTLGRPLVEELRRRGHRVSGVDLEHCPEPPGEYCRADVGSFRQLEHVFAETYDYVYHLAAEFGRLNGEEYYEQLWWSNVIGTRNILEWQLRQGFRLIVASSSEIYGDLGDIALEESVTKRVPVFPPNDYAISKWVNELQCLNFAKVHGSAIVRLRIFNSYGPGEHYHPWRSAVCVFCHHALAGLPFDVYRGYHRAFLFMGDLIPTMANVVENFKPGEVYNLGGRDYRSTRELADIVLAATGADPRLAVMRDGDFPNTPNKRPDISRAERDLGHDPRVGLEEGVARTVAWMRQDPLEKDREESWRRLPPA